MIEKLAVLIPELLEVNNRPADPDQPIDLLLHFHRKTEQREERNGAGREAAGGQCGDVV